MPVFKTLAARQIKLLIAPRNLKFCLGWAAKLQNQAITCCLKTEVADNKSQTLILDTMGELAAAYALADVAMVGGTIDKGVGGHNPLEVMQHQVPLLLGPNTRNFTDIVEQLEDEKAAKICSSAAEFSNAIDAWLNDKVSASLMAQRAFAVLQRNRGALKITIDEAERIFSNKVVSS
jgi:3-deoxy-D-manno-octulosonic-acid transferase